MTKSIMSEAIWNIRQIHRKQKIKKEGINNKTKNLGWTKRTKYVIEQMFSDQQKEIGLTDGYQMYRIDDHR